MAVLDAVAVAAVVVAGVAEWRRPPLEAMERRADTVAIATTARLGVSVCGSWGVVWCFMVFHGVSLVVHL